MHYQVCPAGATFEEVLPQTLHQLDISDSAVLTTYHSLYIQHLKRSSWGWTVTVRNMYSWHLCINKQSVLQHCVSCWNVYIYCKKCYTDFPMSSSNIKKIISSFFLSLSLFLLSFFLSQSDFLCIIMIAAEDYCCTWPHSTPHTHTHSIGLLWTRDRPVTGTSTTRKPHETDIHAPVGIRIGNPWKWAAAEPTLREDNFVVELTHHNYLK